MPNPPLPTSDALDSWRVAAVLLAVFAAIELVIFFVADSSCYVPGTFCANQIDRYGFIFAEAFAEHGAFVIPDSPGEPYTNHPPGFALLLVGVFTIFGWGGYVPVVGVQVAMFVGAALLTRVAVSAVLPGYGTFAMALVLFNPNLIAHVNLIQTVAVEFFLVTAAFASAMAYLRRPSLFFALLCGLAVGLSTMVRPSAQLLVLALPFLFVALEWISDSTVSWRRAWLAGASAVLVAVAIVAPWLAHQNSSGEGLRISSSAHELLLLRDSVHRLMTPADQEQLAEQTERDLKNRNADWDSLGRIRKAQLERDYIIEYYRSFPFSGSQFFGGLAKSWGTFLAGGGEGMFHRLLGMEHQPEKSPFAFYGVKVLAVFFAIALRIIGVLGIIEMVRRRHFGVLLLTTGLVVVYVVPTFLVGQPRYRVPVEPELAIMAVYGFIFLKPFLGRLGLTGRRHGRSGAREPLDSA